MDVREKLIDLLRAAIGALAYDREPPEWTATLAELVEIQDYALKQVEVDSGSVTDLVSAINLLTDCVRRVVSPTEALAALLVLDPARWDDGTGLPVRSGEKVGLPAEGEPMGFSAIAWVKFLRTFGDRLGAASRQQQEDLWNSISEGECHIPVEDVSLADPTGRGSAWVADDGADGYRLRSDDPTHSVYDALGLDWSGLPREKPDDAGGGAVRALLLSCPLRVRRRAAADDLVCPSAVDGWRNLLFVPRIPTGQPWPLHGPATARPDDDTASLPEAVHGPAVAATEEVDVLALGYIRVGQRARECGRDTIARALFRLRTAATP